MDIECGAGRHFLSGEAAKECSESKGGCNQCFLRISYQEKQRAEAINTANIEFSDKQIEHTVLQCPMCRRTTLVRVKENWYECKTNYCKAYGPNPQNLVTLKTIFNKRTEKKEDPSQENSAFSIDWKEVKVNKQGQPNENMQIHSNKYLFIILISTAVFVLIAASIIFILANRN